MDDFVLNVVCFVECFWLSVFGLSGVVGHDVQDDNVTLVDCRVSDFVECLSKFVCDVRFDVVCCCRLFSCGVDAVDMMLEG